MLTVKAFEFNPFSENTYVVSDSSGQCVIIDPGCYTREEQEELRQYIVSNGLTPVGLLNTHAHLDHMLGNAFVHRVWNLSPRLHAYDADLLRSAPVYGEMWGIRPEPSPDPEHLLDEGDVISFGQSKLQVLFVPGHCPGHVAFYEESQRTIFSGDVLFAGSIGRTDLPGGDYDLLMQSIRTRLLVLPDEVKVYSGHGPQTTVGAERFDNPFLT